SFTGTVSVTGGFLRASSVGSLGQNTSASAITLNSGGVLEIRSDSSLNFGSKGITVGTSTTGSRIYVDHAVDGNTLDQTMTVGSLTLSASTSARTFTISGRNGYGVTFGGNMAAASHGDITLTNS